MCETAPQKTYGWKGWSDLPAPRIGSATGPWIDLSHRITEDLSRIPFFPQPVIRQITTAPIRLTQIQWVVHHGTHVDAPCHFISDGPAMDGIPLDRFTARGSSGASIRRIGPPSMSLISNAPPRACDLATSY